MRNHKGIQGDKMQTILPIIKMVKLGINVLSVIILCIGVVFCARDLFLILIAKIPKSEKISRLQYMKTELGSYVLLGLEVLIVADIIETIINPTIDDIILLAAIITIRTVVSLFLNKEIKEIREAAD